MPILGPEPDIYPENLLDAECTAESRAEPDDEIRWWALYTLARREKDLMRRLFAKEVPFYGPLVSRRRRTPGGRSVESFVPLFSSYVFLYGTEQERHEALKTNCISRCLEVKQTGQLLYDLRQVRQLIATGAPLTPEARIQPDTRVRIRSGPMQGLEGIVVKRRGKDCLVVVVQFLQQGASVMLEDFKVESI